MIARDFSHPVDDEKSSASFNEFVCEDDMNVQLYFIIFESLLLCFQTQVNDQIKRRENIFSCYFSFSTFVFSCLD